MSDRLGPRKTCLRVPTVLSIAALVFLVGCGELASPANHPAQGGSSSVPSTTSVPVSSTTSVPPSETPQTTLCSGSWFSDATLNLKIHPTPESDAERSLGGREMPSNSPCRRAGATGQRFALFSDVTPRGDSPLSGRAPDPACYGKVERSLRNARCRAGAHGQVSSRRSTSRRPRRTSTAATCRIR